jgi:hypothetical protein
VSRYQELLDEMQRIAKEYGDAGWKIDQSHPLQRVSHLEALVHDMAWVTAQTLKELQKREQPTPHSGEGHHEA